MKYFYIILGKYTSFITFSGNIFIAHRAAIKFKYGILYENLQWKAGMERRQSKVKT